MMLGYHLTKFSKNAPIPILGHTQSPGRLILCFPHWTTQRRLSVKGRIKKGPINLWPIILPTLICITKRRNSYVKKIVWVLALRIRRIRCPPLILGLSRDLSRLTKEEATHISVWLHGAQLFFVTECHRAISELRHSIPDQKDQTMLGCNQGKCDDRKS